MSTAGPSTYVCGNCGQALPVGARWCPGCHSTEAVFVGRDPGASPVIQVTPPTITKDEAIWKTSGAAPDGRSLFQRVNNPRMKEPIYGRPTSRWQGGATTFGPTGRILTTVAVICALILAFSVNSLFFFVFSPIVALVVWLVMRDVWRKGQVDAPADAPVASVMDGVRELRESKNVPATAVPTESEARTDATAAALAAIASAASANPYRRFGTGSKIAWTALILLFGAVVLVFSVGSPDFSGKEAAWGPPFYVVAATIALWAIWRK